VSAYSANGIATYQWPREVTRLVVFADQGKAGQEGADTLRARAFRAYMKVEVFTPNTEGHDWADVWVNRSEEAA
jgi:putative DNA primase/helicase